jgi:SAM-dependent methyltransferase
MRRVYEAEYIRNREGNGIVQSFAMRLEGWMHRMVSKCGADHSNGPVLELGAGTLNHLSYEPNVTTYDVAEPFLSLLDVGNRRSRLRSVYRDIHDIEGQDIYSRILSIATLEHVLDLPQLVERAAHLVRPDGIFQSAIPSEGGLLWYLSWRYGTGLPFYLRTGLSYKELMAHEHVNNAEEIETVIRYYYEDVLVRRFPTRWLHGSFYTYIEGAKPRVR